MRRFSAYFLLVLAIISAVLSVQKFRWILETSLANAILWCLLVVCLGLFLWNCWKRRWIAGLFHLGMGLLIIGGGLTAGKMQEAPLRLVEPLYAETLAQYRASIFGDGVTLKSFTIDTYENGMPKQYRSVLAFDEGEYELSVNHPLRRKGVMYYQISYAYLGTYYDGTPVYQTMIMVRRDPGVRWIYGAYAILILAAACQMVKELRQ